jgi:hypothetical protein
MSAGQQQSLGASGEYASRLAFLYTIVEDTQATIRFIDTKAAFCVTLLSGMLAAEFQFISRQPANAVHHALQACFIVALGVCLLICLRVIFPVIKTHGGETGIHRGPKFFIGHNKGGHWFLHTFRNRIGPVLSENIGSYVASLEATTDEDLLHSMCDEVLMISLIRQVKSDRLHAAMICLVATIVVFLVTIVL